MSPTPPPPRLAQLGVTIAYVACLLGTLVGTGVIGTRVQESAGGSLSAEATLIAPAGPAFSIWSVIYAGLLVTQGGWLWVSVGVIVALAVVLKVTIAQLTRHPAHGWVDGVLLDGTFGLYLGWVAVATCANIAATLVDGGLSPTGIGAEATTVGLLVVVAALGLLYARVFERRWAIAVAMAWGLGWVAWGRLATEPASPSQSSRSLQHPGMGLVKTSPGPSTPVGHRPSVTSCSPRLAAPPQRASPWR